MTAKANLFILVTAGGHLFQEVERVGSQQWKEIVITVIVKDILLLSIKDVNKKIKKYATFRLAYVHKIS